MFVFCLHAPAYPLCCCTVPGASNVLTSCKASPAGWRLPKARYSRDPLATAFLGLSLPGPVLQMSQASKAVSRRTAARGAGVEGRRPAVLQRQAKPRSYQRRSGPLASLLQQGSLVQRTQARGCGKHQPAVSEAAAHMNECH